MATVKPEIRVLGVDDAPFSFDDRETTLVGTVFRGGDYIEAVMTQSVTVDGFDSTDRIVDMMVNGRHRDQVQVMLLDGVTVAGFNVVDLDRVAAETGCGVVAVSRREPDADDLDAALENVEQADARRELLEAAGAVLRYETDDGPLFFQYSGMDDERARAVLDSTVVRGVLPEPVRVSHLIGAALKNGKSKGRA